MSNELYTTNTTSIEPKNIPFGDLFRIDLLTWWETHLLVDLEIYIDLYQLKAQFSLK